MLIYKNYKQSETGMNETKSFFSRMKRIFRFHKKKKKLESDTVNKIERSNTYNDSCSNTNTSSQRSINSCNSKSSNNSIDIKRDNNDKYEIVLPYERFINRN